MIKVENLKKVFRSEDIEIETVALDGVSFEINDGEFVAIVIGVSSWRIARMNPVKSLKDE